MAVMRSVWILLVLLAVCAGLRFWRLGEPPKQYFDEIYYARTAREYLLGQPIYEWTHPPLSKLLIAAGIRAFGFTPWGWRVASALSGTVLTAVLYALGRYALCDPHKGVLLAFFGTVEPFFLVESRIAKPEIFLLLFLTGAYAAWWAGFRRRRLLCFALAGLLAGAAAATKWTGAASVGVLVLMTALAWRRGELERLAGPAMAALLLLPAIPYTLSYLPHLLRGSTLLDLVRLHADMYRYHSTLVATHPYTSPWWSWPLLLRPMWYYYEAKGGLMAGVFVVGNPALWWAILPALAFVAWRAVHKRRLGDLFVLTGFALSYLPYTVIGRLLFIYHMLPTLPFAYLAIASGLEGIRNRWGAEWAHVYLGAAAGLFVYYLPILTAYPVPATWLRWWTITRSWI